MQMTLLFIAIEAILMFPISIAMDKTHPKAGNLNPEKDLLLVQFDCKTDVDYDGNGVINSLDRIKCLQSKI